MTPKQRVLKKFPEAIAWKWAGSTPWCVYTRASAGRCLAWASPTAQDAWAVAATKIRRRADSAGVK